MQNLMNNPVIKTNGLNCPKNNWIPKIGNANNGNNLNVHNNVFLAGNMPNRSKMVYLENNLNNGKIKHVYNLNSLKEWLKMQKFSPMTRKQVNSWNKVKLVPNKIIEKVAHTLELAKNDINYLISLTKEYNLKSVTILDRFKNLLNVENVYRFKFKNMCHSKSQSDYNSLRNTCAVYGTMLRVYIDKSKNKKKLLKELSELNPPCIENLCVTIKEFIHKDEHGFDFDFDTKASKLINISNCANAYRNMYCNMLIKKELTRSKFLTKMEDLQSIIWTHLKNKKASNGEIKLIDVYNFMFTYGDLLLECSSFIFPNNFKFRLSATATYVENV